MDTSIAPRKIVHSSPDVDFSEFIVGGINNLKRVDLIIVTGSDAIDNVGEIALTRKT